MTPEPIPVLIRLTQPKTPDRYALVTAPTGRVLSSTTDPDRAGVFPEPLAIRSRSLYRSRKYTDPDDRIESDPVYPDDVEAA